MLPNAYLKSQASRLAPSRGSTSNENMSILKDTKRQPQMQPLTECENQKETVSGPDLHLTHQ